MTEMHAGSIRPFYADWAGYNRRITEALGRLSPDDLALQAPGSDHWPIWAIAGHMAGARVFWLCEIFGEPGIASTPWPNGTSMGWEDDLTTPRRANELVEALTSTWQVIEGCLARWTPDTLGETFDRREGDRHEVHTRQSILLRMIHHEAYHAGEISLTLGANGRTPIDLWPGADWLAGVPVARREGDG